MVSISIYLLLGNFDTWHTGNWLGGVGSTWVGTDVWYHPPVQSLRLDSSFHLHQKNTQVISIHRLHHSYWLYVSHYKIHNTTIAIHNNQINKLVFIL